MNAAADTPPELILASASPRRLELLTQLGMTAVRVAPTTIDEKILVGETPRLAATRLSAAKAEAAWGQNPGTFIVAADTIVAVGRRILGKPPTREKARSMLTLVSGRGHRVFTGVALIAPDGRRACRLSETRVKFARLTGAQAETLLDCGEWRDAAGGYRIQGRAGAYGVALIGSYSGVVGLPLFETANLLRGLGYPLP